MFTHILETSAACDGNNCNMKFPLSVLAKLSCYIALEHLNIRKQPEDLVFPPLSAKIY